MLRQQLQQKLQQKLSPQQIQLIRLLELPAIELEERIIHELEENPALEEGREPVDDFEGDEDGNIESTNDSIEDLSLGDYLTEDDIPDYKLREMSDRTERKEDVPFSVNQSLHEHLLQQLGLRDLTETESKQTLDAFIEAMLEIAEMAKSDPDALHLAPITTPVGRPDQTQAARKPVVKWP